jgi:hypothetical protein
MLEQLDSLAGICGLSPPTLFKWIGIMAAADVTHCHRIRTTSPKTRHAVRSPDRDGASMMATWTL